MSATVWKVNGKVVSRRRFKRGARGIPTPGTRQTHAGSTWPLVSSAMGVHPSQVAEVSEQSRQIGIPTEFKADGSCVFTSARHRKQYCERTGYFDRNGGYSDPQPKRVS